jgi:hypothetical protein
MIGGLDSYLWECLLPDDSICCDPYVLHVMPRSRCNTLAVTDLFFGFLFGALQLIIRRICQQQRTPQTVRRYPRVFFAKN